ncbi:MAG: EAL domain-containing protein [Janthinobacterium lividum]
MDTPVDASSLLSKPGHDPQGAVLAAERRRNGRPSYVSRNLVPLLRVTPPADGAGSSPPDAATLRAAKACAACRDGTQIFPFTMAFQPIVDMHAGRIDAYEALVRGPGGEGAGHVLGQVTAENTYAFDQACRVKAIGLASRLGIDRQLSINFLPNAVYQPQACIQATLRAAASTGFPRDRLTFEILESETIADTGHLMAIITEYRKHGFKIALDDFSTGYSGLARLAELKPDIIKVDRALVQNCDKDRTRLAIIASLISLGNEIGVKVVVEGVEQASEVAALRSVGARFIQGFYFAKPLFEGAVRDSDIPWTIPAAP